jgi:hypothetical protein
MHVVLAVGARFNLQQIFELRFFIFSQSLHRNTSIRTTSSFQICSYSSFMNHPIIERLFFLDFVTLETGTDMFSRNVSMEFALYAE